MANNHEFRFTPWFSKSAKPLIKRNPQFTEDLQLFLAELDASPDAHPIVPKTGGARKARMKISGRGKSSSYRVFYYIAIRDTIWLLTIYDKVRTENLSQSEIADLAELVQNVKNG